MVNQMNFNPYMPLGNQALGGSQQTQIPQGAQSFPLSGLNPQQTQMPQVSVSPPQGALSSTSLNSMQNQQPVVQQGPGASLGGLFSDGENLSAKDKYMALMMGGFKMAEAAGTPGATLIGSLGSGGQTYGSVLSQLDAKNAATKVAASKAKREDEQFGATLGLKEKELGINRIKAAAALRKASSPTDKLSKLIAARDSLKEGDPNIAVYDDAITKETSVSNTTSLGKLIDARDALAPDDPSRALFDAAIKKKTDSTGLRITTDAEGNTVIEQGSLGQGDDFGAGMTKDIQEKILSATGYLDQVRQMEYMFDPEMMKVPNRAWLRAMEMGEKFDINTLNDDERFELQKFNTMKSDSQALLSAIIKELAGAAVSKQEQERIEGFLPTFGVGIFDGDSPSLFQDKMKDFMSSTESALMRNKMFLGGKKGITGPQSYSFPLRIANNDTKQMIYFSDFVNQMREANINAGNTEPGDTDIAEAWQDTVKSFRKKR